MHCVGAGTCAVRRVSGAGAHGATTHFPPTGEGELKACAARRA